MDAERHDFVAAVRDGEVATVTCRCGWSVAGRISECFDALERHLAPTADVIELVEAESAALVQQG